MPDEFRLFDYNTITDVILHLRYTARDGGNTLRNEVEKAEPGGESLKNRFIKNGFMRLFSLKHDFPQAFHQLTHPPAGSENRPVELLIAEQHLPYFLAQDNLEVKELKIYLQSKEPNGRVDNRSYGIAVNNTDVRIGTATSFGKNMIVASVETNSGERWTLKGAHTIQINSGRLPNNVGDVLLMFVV
jgi:hypothetical protein